MDAVLSVMLATLSLTVGGIPDEAAAPPEGDTPPAPESSIPASVPYETPLQPEAHYLSGLLFPGSDFETGNLDGWRLEGGAFERQPTYGDNVAARHSQWRAMPAGQFFIGTFENYRGRPGETPGTTQGDHLTGGLISPTFLIEEPYITFLIGGGDLEGIGVRLIVGGEVVREATGANAEEMRREWWDVSDFVGQQGQLYLIDRERGAWGHLNADDFRFATEIPDTRLFPNSDFEKGTLENWEGEGTAFEFQPTKGDTIITRHAHETANLRGTYWINTYDKYQGLDGQTPGDTVGDEATGLLRSKAFVISGDLIVFQIAGGMGEGVGVHLEVDTERVRTTRGRNHPSLQNASWDVQDLRGRVGRIVIEDRETGSWGAISANDFRYGRF